MKLYDLGTLPWKQTQLVYHALGELGEESVVICTPKERYACVGFAQNPAHELDIDYCKKNNIGIFRREIGGGTVFIDDNQIFYQLIIDRGKSPLNQVVFFERFLQPIIRTYKSLGIDAKFNPICDLVVNGKKISGNGGGDIGNCKVGTGSILLDFDHETMSRILNLPSEKFRQNVLSAMKTNMATVKTELDKIPSMEEIKTKLISNWIDTFDDLEKSELDQLVFEKMDELDKKFSTEEWLYKIKKQNEVRSIKIIEGLNLVYSEFEGIELCIETQNDIIRDVKILNSDIKISPSQLGKMLANKRYDKTLVLNKIKAILENPTR